jgi:hypothetical protein
MYEVLFRGSYLKIPGGNRWANRASAQDYINRHTKETGLCAGDYSIREVNVNAGVSIFSGRDRMRKPGVHNLRPDPVYHPPHYEKLTPEPIEVIESWGLDFHRAQVLKYLARAGNKPGNSREQDLRKARYYLDRAISVGRA